MSTRVMRDTNAAVKDMKDIIELLSDDEAASLLGTLDVDWKTNSLLTADPRLLSILEKQGHVESEAAGFRLTRTGRALMGRLLVDLGTIPEEMKVIGEKYAKLQQISCGRNSVAFRAEHTILETDVVLKFIRPGAAPDLASSLRKLKGVADHSRLVHPIDYIRVPYRSVTGQPLELECVVFPFVEGRTLEDYLRSSPPLTPYFFEAFLRQVGSALAALERVGAYHGDLHSENLLVTESKDRLEFRLIDVSFGIGLPSGQRQYEPSDLELVRQHIWRALTMLQRTLKHISIRKHLGARLYELVDRVLSADNITFADIVELLALNPDYERFLRQRERFIREKFPEPPSLGLLRYEEITDPAAAVELFEPYTELFERVSSFGNTLLYGPRGSGKSTYLASLAFFPRSDREIVDFRDIFGVLFSCRQGEFKQFSPQLVRFSAANVLRIKHIILLRIIRRVMSTLATAIECKRIDEPAGVERLYALLERYVQRGTLGPFAGAGVSPIRNLHAALARHEIWELDRLFGSSEKDNGGEVEPMYLLNESDLRDFLEEVRRAFPILGKTQFYILFDDAGHPNVPSETQRIINDVVRSINAVYCIKLSAERFSYVTEDSSGKVLEEGHDFASADIARALSPKAGIDPERERLEKYFRSIVAKRLAHWHYRSDDIADYVNDRFYKTDELVERLANGRRNAYYAGWDVVWQVADRTTRSLLELVSEIFAAGEIDATSPPAVVKAHIQNKAIRRVSERKLKALVYTPGSLKVEDQVTSRGQQLYDFATAFGRVSAAYLKRRQPRKKGRALRFDERLAIERNDSSELDKDAGHVLRELVRFGVLDDTRFGTARDDEMRKPIYIFNRIFCPAFGISYRRDAHLRLSRAKLELFLRYPLEFAKTGTRFLAQLNKQDRGSEPELFNDYSNE